MSSRRYTSPPSLPIPSLSSLVISEPDLNPSPPILEEDSTDGSTANSTLHPIVIKEGGSDSDGDNVPNWINIPSSLFSVRSPSYSTTRLKVPSPPALFICKSCITYSSKSKHDDVLQVITDKVKGTGDWIERVINNQITENLILAVTFQIPFTHSYTSSSPSGGQITFFYIPTPSFSSSLNSNYGGITSQWLHHGLTSSSVRSLFKLIIQLPDPDILPVPLRSYNSKPVLITKSGRMKETCLNGNRFIEMKCDLHGWGTFTRKAIVKNLDNLKIWPVRIGVLVETRDDEGGEVLIGAVEVKGIDTLRLFDVDEVEEGED